MFNVVSVLAIAAISHLFASSCSGFNVALLLLVEPTAAPPEGEEDCSCSERHLSL